MIETGTLIIISIVGLYVLGAMWFTWLAFKSTRAPITVRHIIISTLAGIFFPLFIIWFWLEK